MTYRHGSESVAHAVARLVLASILAICDPPRTLPIDQDNYNDNGFQVHSGMRPFPQVAGWSGVSL